MLTDIPGPPGKNTGTFSSVLSISWWLSLSENTPAKRRWFGIQYASNWAALPRGLRWI